MGGSQRRMQTALMTLARLCFEAGWWVCSSYTLDLMCGIDSQWVYVKYFVLQNERTCPGLLPCQGSGTGR